MAHKGCDFVAAKKYLMKMAGIGNGTPVSLNSPLLKVTNYLENVERFYTIQPFFFDKSGMFWFWRGSKWEIVDDIDVMDSIDKELSFGGETVSSSIKTNYLEAFRRIGRRKIPKDAPKHWVQFKDKIFDIRTKKWFDATPEHFICNPIPWKAGKTDKTPIIDKLFEDWVGEDYVGTLHEIISYCCLIDYPIHLIFCLIGIGRNGKTKFQQLLCKFIGKSNICSTELDTLLDSRFESTKLYKKLICIMGETNFGIMNRTSLLKKLTGQDLIGFEYKMKKPFDDYNYGKIIINSNSLPISEDTSEGFYRRWLIIDFPNTFQEGKNILDLIPEEEYENLVLKVCKILPSLLERGNFTHQGSIDSRKTKYILASNPFTLFVDNCCAVSNCNYIRYSELYIAYVKYLKDNKRRIVSKKEFTKVLTEEGFESRKTWKNEENAFFIEGLELKPKKTTQDVVKEEAVNTI